MKKTTLFTPTIEFPNNRHPNTEYKLQHLPTLTLKMSYFHLFLDASVGKISKWRSITFALNGQEPSWEVDLDIFSSPLMGDGVRRPPLNQEDNERTGRTWPYENTNFFWIHTFFSFKMHVLTFNGYGRVVVLLHVHPWWDDDDDMNSPQWLNDHKLECSDFQTKEC
jgi:hypothetical protein